jgi:hypothetical protein
MLLCFFVIGEVGFETLGEFAAGEHDAPSAAFAYETDVRAEAGDGPFVGTARMLFSEAKMIVETQVR